VTSRLNGNRSSAVPQSKALDVRGPQLSKNFDNSIDTVLATLRTCVHEKGWTLEALESEMRIDKSLISRVLNGERPLTLAFLLALPDDVEVLFETRRAEAFGLLVVPRLEGDAAAKAFASGLLGLLGGRLPAKAALMAKANLDKERP